VSEFNTSTEDALRAALRLLLDHIDYQNGACRPTEMVAAALPGEVLQRCKNVLIQEKKA